MSTEFFGAYSEGVDALVNVIEGFRSEDFLFPALEGNDDGYLATIVDGYTARSRELLAWLIDREASTDRVLALAAGDFRLAASLALLSPFTDEPLVDDAAAAYAALRIDLADL